MRRLMYQIGEFSKITGLTVKTLRFYDEQGLLKPSCVDPDSGYRYYDEGRIAVAHAVKQLRSLECSVADIAELLSSFEDDADVVEFLERQRASIREKLAHYREVNKRLDRIIQQEREAREIMSRSTFVVEEKSVDPVLMAGVRMKGKYSDCGRGFAQIGKRLGRYISGKPFLLHYDSEYREDDADFEACMPIRQRVEADSISVRELPGGRCVSLLHQGPYDELGRSYAKVFEYVKQRGYEVEMPTREVYHKGPGMIFRGNPKKYLTEIQVLLKG